MQGKGKLFLRARLRWRIRILLTCSPVLTCPGVRSEHQLVKAEAERTAQNSAPRADIFSFRGDYFSAIPQPVDDDASINLKSKVKC